AFRNTNQNVRKISSEAATRLKSDALIPYLVRELNSDNRFVRVHAAEALYNMGWNPRRRKSIDYWIGLRDWGTLNEWDLKKKIHRIVQELEFNQELEMHQSQLLQILSEYKQSSKPIISLLKNGSENVKYQALQILALNEEDKSGINKCLDLYKDESSKVRSMLATMILETEHKLPKKVYKVLEVLIQDEDVEVQIQASMAYKRLRSIKSVPRLIERLKQGNLTSKVQQNITQVFILIGEQAVQPILKAIGEEDEILVEVATEAFTKIRTPKSVPLYSKYFQNGNPYQVAVAATALANIDQRKYLGDLLALFKSKQAILKLAAIKSLGPLIGDESLRNYIVPLLEDPDFKVRYHTSQLLEERSWEPENPHEDYVFAKASGNWEYAASIKGFNPTLEDEMKIALESHIPQLMRPTAIAMAKLASTAIDSFVDLAFDDDEELKIVVINQLIELGTKSIQSVIAAYDRYDDYDHKAVLVDIMAKIGGPSVEHKLVEILNLENSNQEIRILAMKTLDLFDSSVAIPTYVTLLSGENRELAQLAADELVEIGENSIGDLTHLIQTSDNKLVITVSHILGRLKTTEAISVLVSKLKDEALDVRHAVGTALRQIGWIAPPGSNEEIYMLIALEDWSRIERMGNQVMTKLIKLVQVDKNSSVRDHSAEIMKTLWPTLPTKSTQVYENEFRRLLGPRAHPVFEYLIDFGYEKPPQSIVSRIAGTIKGFAFSNSYYLFAILSAFILLAFVEEQFGEDAFYSTLQFWIVFTVLFFQFGQSALITNYTERFIGIMETAAGLFGRGRRVAIWANRHFPLIVAIIFLGTFYKILTTEPGSVEFVENQDSLVGKFLGVIATGNYGFINPVFDISFPSLGITDWFGIVDLPSLDLIFVDTRLSLFLRGIIFLAVAVEVYKVGYKAIYQRNPIPNDPPRFYQKFALLGGLLIFYMLAFVEESSYSETNSLFKDIPAAITRLGILIGSLTYLIFYSKDKPLGWITVLIAIPTFAILKLIEIIIVPNAMNPFSYLEDANANGIIIALIQILSTAPIALYLNKRLVDQLVHDETYTKDHTTVNILVRYSWRIWFTTYISYAIYILAHGLPKDIETNIIDALIQVPSAIIILIYIIWSYRMLREPVLRLNTLFSLIPSIGLLYLVWGRNADIEATKPLTGIEEALSSWVLALFIFPLIFIGIRILRRTLQLAEDEADLEGINARILRNVRTTRFVWTLFLLVYFLVFSVELGRDIQKLVFN
ncbi:MAG: hypothetical protein IH840_10640, partial [Candidatus Heimdallarchaeota archaeon]|nr:hypothetical protein [Candidatus Heimdallarchaeota archaeon]